MIESCRVCLELGKRVIYPFSSATQQQQASRKRKKKRRLQNLRIFIFLAAVVILVFNLKFAAAVSKVKLEKIICIKLCV